MPKCIYCLKEKSKKKFNLEHLVPQSLVTFGKNTITLKELVCEDCNEKFGKTIDRELIVNSIEGLIANQIGVSKIKGVFKPKDLNIKMVDNKLGIRFKNVEMYFDSRKRSFVPYRQLLFKNVKGNIITIRENQYSNNLNKLRKLLTKENANYKNRFEIIEYSSGQTKKLEKFLKNINPKVKIHNKEELSIKEYSETHKQILCSTRIRITKQIERALCKIAFNFAAYCLGNKQKIIFNERFNVIRDFIRKGKKDSQDFIKVSTEPIFVGETQKLRLGSKYGCSFLLHWQKLPYNLFNLESQISLFNLFRYDIILCRKYAPLIIASLKFQNNRPTMGKYFDPIKKREIRVIGCGRDKQTGLPLIN